MNTFHVDFQLIEKKTNISIKVKFWYLPWSDKSCFLNLIDFSVRMNCGSQENKNSFLAFVVHWKKSFSHPINKTCCKIRKRIRNGFINNNLISSFLPFFLLSAAQSLPSSHSNDYNLSSTKPVVIDRPRLRGNTFQLATLLPYQEKVRSTHNQIWIGTTRPVKYLFSWGRRFQHASFLEHGKTFDRLFSMF